jgi:hypothetical protein
LVDLAFVLLDFYPSENKNQVAKIILPETNHFGNDFFVGPNSEREHKGDGWSVKNRRKKTCFPQVPPPIRSASSRLPIVGITQYRFNQFVFPKKKEKSRCFFWIETRVLRFPVELRLKTTFRSRSRRWHSDFRR